MLYGWNDWIDSRSFVNVYEVFQLTNSEDGEIIVTDITTRCKVFRTLH